MRNANKSHKLTYSAVVKDVIK